MWRVLRTSAGHPLIDLHDRVIQPDGEQHGALLLAFPSQGGLDFLLYPIALDGVFREDEQ